MHIFSANNGEKLVNLCMDFVRSHFGTNYRYPFVMKKVFNWSELHRFEVTSYKIHILEKESKI
jgi:hypothetical protein